METYAAGPWLARRYQRALEQEGQRRRCEDQQPINGELVARLAEQEDTLAMQIMTEAGKALGVAVASMP